VRIRPANDLAARLFAAQTLVAVAGAATLWVVAAVIGPAIFQNHLDQAQVAQVSADTARHVDEAFRSASAVSIGVALSASLVAALAISAFATRRIAGPVVRLAAAAGDVAAGRDIEIVQQDRIAADVEGGLDVTAILLAAAMMNVGRRERDLGNDRHAVVGLHALDQPVLVTEGLEGHVREMLVGRLGFLQA